MDERHDIFTKEEIQDYLITSDNENNFVSDRMFNQTSSDEEDEEEAELEDNEPRMPRVVRRTRKYREEEWSADVLPVGREKFTAVNTGVQNPEEFFEDGEVSIVKIYESFVPEELIDNMIMHTNNYAKLLMVGDVNLHGWRDVEREEMKLFFAVLILMTIARRPSVDDYFVPRKSMLYMPVMSCIHMTKVRFRAIMRCWHFTEVQIDSTGEQKTYKIEPLINKLVDSFRRVYVPGEVMIINEPVKMNDIKIQTACTVDSYVWSYICATKKPFNIHGLDGPGSIVVELVEPLLDEGRLILTDYFHTSIHLAEYLKDRRTDLCGGIDKKAGELPMDIVKAKLNKWELLSRQKDNYITLLKFREYVSTMMISTCHGDGTSVVKMKRGILKFPDAFIDFCDAKANNEELIEDVFPNRGFLFEENVAWYKRVAIDLLFKVAVCNAMVIHNELSDDTNTFLEIQSQLCAYYANLDSDQSYGSNDSSVSSYHGGSSDSLPESLVYHTHTDSDSDDE